eukprot:COSAG03_NODE_3886_length_1780_cov_1.341463_2_plen_84_part_01
MHTQLTELTTPALLPCWRRAVNPLASVPIAILKVIVIMLLLDRFMPHTAHRKQRKRDEGESNTAPTAAEQECFCEVAAPLDLEE